MASYFKTEEEFLAPVGYEEIVYNKLNRRSDILSPLPSSVGERLVTGPVQTKGKRI